MIQPFDGGKFDKRFADVFAPAVEGAGLTPYRVDRDPGVSIPIQEIERGIRDAAVCFVDITVDNPNVWFELGYAIAVAKDLCIVCAEERTKYPFDIQHRTVIRYQTESSSDFKKLAEAVTLRIKSILKQQEARGDLQSVTTAPPSGLEEIEVVCLASSASILEGEHDANTHFQIKNAMDKAGYNQLATNVALRKLMGKSLMQRARGESQDGEYFGYNLTDSGWEWLAANTHRMKLSKSKNGTAARLRDIDDEIPF